ncbi:methyltransferase family protein [Paenibacillus taihuensis]|uniref:Methyltransferase family protein n=1 Tax=Paenibacillus taihuensis TaxID=1156355 RepID=A0A3D9R214_9BACL|nr:class I SAM-dependent methyltransferase [Paenibacillus taihuensis]REE68763.1 methyltransferase family protein [Paenibacillus taihuensis]
MDDHVDIVKRFYDDTVHYEWHRLDRHKIEFELTKRYLDRYLKLKDRVLDLGGGPGNYSLYLAELGCDVTLADLSPKNIEFAQNKAQELGLPLHATCADSRDLSAFEDESFDHILCMGPMYHLQDEHDRMKTINECLSKLTRNGTLFVSFVSSFSFVWDYLLRDPSLILLEERKSELHIIRDDVNFAGHGFTENFYIRPKDVLPFFEKFEVEKLHLVNCESFLYLREPELLAQPAEVVTAWLDLAEQVCEREDLMSVAEHLMYIGRKG